MFDFSVCVFSLQLWRCARDMTGAFSLLLCYQIFIKMVKNRSFLEKNMITTIKKRFIFCLFPCVLSFWFCFKFAHGDVFLHFPPERWSKHALNFIHVEAFDVSPLLFCVRDFGSFYFLPRLLRRRVILLGRKACEQNTVRKPQPTKCWVSFLIIFPIFFAVRVCLYLVSFGIFNCFVHLCLCVFQIYIRFVVESLSLSFS